MELRGAGAIVTGGSRGLGAALGKSLAARGARVVLVARDRAPLEEVVAEITARGGEAHALAEDLGDKEAIHRIAGAASALVGSIDLLVHNASTLGPVPLRLLLDTDCEDLERALAVNVVGPFRLTKAVAGSMALRGRGVVLHVSSDAAVSAYPRWGAYGVSKAALDHLNRTWGAELDGTGVRFLSVDPGEMNTKMHADAIPEADPDDARRSGRRRRTDRAARRGGRGLRERGAPGGVVVSPATWPRDTPLDEGLVVVDPRARRFALRRVRDLASHVTAGDLVVLNDAATLPAALRGETTARGEPVEARPPRLARRLVARGPLRRRRLARAHRGSPAAPPLPPGRPARLLRDRSRRDRRPARPRVRSARRPPLPRPAGGPLLVRALPSRAPRPVLLHRRAARPVARPDSVCVAPLVERDAVGRAPARVGARPRAAGEGGPLRVGDARGRSLVLGRRAARRGHASPRIVRGPRRDRRRCLNARARPVGPGDRRGDERRPRARIRGRRDRSPAARRGERRD